MTSKAKRKPGGQPKPGGRVRFNTTLPYDVVRGLRDMTRRGNASQAIIGLYEVVATLRAIDEICSQDHGPAAIARVSDITRLAVRKLDSLRKS